MRCQGGNAGGGTALHRNQRPHLLGRWEDEEQERERDHEGSPLCPGEFQTLTYTVAGVAPTSMFKAISGVPWLILTQPVRTHFPLNTKCIMKQLSGGSRGDTQPP